MQPGRLKNSGWRCQAGLCQLPAHTDRVPGGRSSPRKAINDHGVPSKPIARQGERAELSAALPGARSPRSAFPRLTEASTADKSSEEPEWSILTSAIPRKPGREAVNRGTKGDINTHPRWRLQTGFKGWRETREGAEIWGMLLPGGGKSPNGAGRAKEEIDLIFFSLFPSVGKGGNYSIPLSRNPSALRDATEAPPSSSSQKSLIFTSLIVPLSLCSSQCVLQMLGKP